MKHFKLKFTYGVELGATIAYIGHHRRTKDPRVGEIAWDELRHRMRLKYILADHGEEPSPIINGVFQAIGSVVAALCQVSPLWSLNLVARLLESFAVYSYRDLAREYPFYQDEMLEMARTEAEHERYFKSGGERK